MLGPPFQHSSLFSFRPKESFREFKTQRSDEELVQDDIDWFNSTSNFEILISSYSVHYLAENHWRDTRRNYREVMFVGHLINSNPMPVCHIYFKDYLDLDEIFEFSSEQEFAPIGLMNFKKEGYFPSLDENVFFSPVMFKADFSVLDLEPQFSKSIVETMMRHLDLSVQELLILRIGTVNSVFKDLPFDYRIGELKVINKMAVVTSNILDGGYWAIRRKFETTTPEKSSTTFWEKLNQPAKWIMLALVVYFLVGAVRTLIGFK